MTRRQWAILGTLAVAVLCVCGALGFLVVRDFRSSAGKLAKMLTPVSATAAPTAQTTGAGSGTAATPVPGKSETSSNSGTSQLPDDPLEATKLIETKAQGLRSAHVVLSLQLKIKAPPGVNEEGVTVPVPDHIQVTGEGDFVDKGPNEMPDLQMKLRVQMPDETRTLEVVQVNGRQWVKSDGKWEENKDFKQQAATGGEMTTNPLSVLFGLEAMGDITRLSDETIDGAPTYHYRFSVDPQKMFSSEKLSTDTFDPSMFMAMFQDLKFEVEVWADQSTLWLRQEKLILGAKINVPPQDNKPAESISLDIEATIKLSKHNQPVEIKPPL
jgi:hypothetical protein